MTAFSDMLTFSEVCGRLRMTPKTLRKIIQSGELNAIRVGTHGRGRKGQYRISEEDLADYMKRQEVQEPA